VGGPLHGSSLSEGIMVHYKRITIHIGIATMDMYSFQNIMYLDDWIFYPIPNYRGAGRLNPRKNILIRHYEQRTIPTTNVLLLGTCSEARIHNVTIDRVLEGRGVHSSA